MLSMTKISEHDDEDIVELEQPKKVRIEESKLEHIFEDEKMDFESSFKTSSFGFTFS